MPAPVRLDTQSPPVHLSEAVVAQDIKGLRQMAAEEDTRRSELRSTAHINGAE
jgi:hypothetical protein